MDLANLIDYEKTIAHELVHPVTGEKTGVVFHVRSMESKTALKAHSDAIKSFSSIIKEGGVISDEMGEEADLRRLASCVVSWDWGKVKWNKKPAPEFSIDAAVEIFGNQNWIKNQIWGVAAKLANFTSTNETDSANT